MCKRKCPNSLIGTDIKDFTQPALPSKSHGVFPCKWLRTHTYTHTYFEYVFLCLMAVNVAVRCDCMTSGVFNGLTQTDEGLCPLCQSGLTVGEGTSCTLALSFVRALAGERSNVQNSLMCATLCAQAERVGCV